MGATSGPHPRTFSPKIGVDARIASLYRPASRVVVGGWRLAVSPSSEGRGDDQRLAFDSGTRQRICQCLRDRTHRARRGVRLPVDGECGNSGCDELQRFGAWIASPGGRGRGVWRHCWLCAPLLLFDNHAYQWSHRDFHGSQHRSTWHGQYRRERRQLESGLRRRQRCRRHHLRPHHRGRRWHPRWWDHQQRNPDTRQQHRVGKPCRPQPQSTSDDRRRRHLQRRDVDSDAHHRVGKRGVLRSAAAS